MRYHKERFPSRTVPRKPNGAVSELIMQEMLLTTEQVAQYLKVDKFTVYRLVTQRKMPAFKVGGQWRYKKKLIDAWLLENSNISGRESN
jgi:excisionase family DNA binding protein